MAPWRPPLLLSLLLFLSSDVVLRALCEPMCAPMPPPDPVPVYPLDVALLHFALNLEHLECEFLLFGAKGCGLDCVEPELAMGGPPPIGAMKANLDETTERIMLEFGYQEVGHLRAIKTSVGGFPRPLLNLSSSNFAEIVNNAMGVSSPVSPPFDPYANSLNFILASYIIPYMGLVGYVGANPNLNGYISKRLLAGLLGVEAGQDAVIRALLFERKDEFVEPYGITVADFTDRISELRNRLAGCGIKDEGLTVPPLLGAEGRMTTNVLSANRDSLSYRRTPEEILRVVYGTGNEHIPGGFFPLGGNGEIARELLGDCYVP